MLVPWVRKGRPDRPVNAEIKDCKAFLVRRVRKAFPERPELRDFRGRWGRRGRLGLWGWLSGA